MATRSRPAQGQNSKPVATARPAYTAQPGPSGPVGRGSVSRPKALPKWSPKAQPAPRRVNNPKTIA
jgi:hypothetical protein